MKRLKRCLCTLIALTLAMGTVSAAAFTDLPQDSPYAEAAATVSRRGLMKGIGQDEFGPDMTIDRSMFVTILHRLAGSPAAVGGDFADVAADAWYGEAVSWGTSRELILGTGDKSFSPDQQLTWEQVALFLYRYCRYMGYQMGDQTSEAQWALDAQLLPVGASLQDKPTRGQVAVCLSRLLAWMDTDGAKATDTQFPVTLSDDGKTVTYGPSGRVETITLGEKDFYIDGRLSEAEAAKSPYVFRSFTDALAQVTDGTREKPMNLWLAPWVYWIHDPASPSTDKLFEIEINCQELHITGLTDEPRNVVIAGNYGHDLGYDGANPTMFQVNGDGLTLKNLTFGNYCCNDLIYPLDPSLNMAKRSPSSNITQGQIGALEGDRLFAQNVRFVSRLNMNPFVSSGRALYVDCHMESTADSLNDSAHAVYLRCDFDFYATKPWWHSNGVTVLDSTMHILHGGDHHMVKVPGPFTVIDSRFETQSENVALKWCDVQSDTYRSYVSNNTLNGSPVAIDTGDYSVDITNSPLLGAYKTTVGGETVYNVYNLLRGDDDWDPLGQKELLTAQDLPTGLTALVGETDQADLVSGADTLTATAALTGPRQTDYQAALTWSGDQRYVKLTPSADTMSCTIEGVNTEELPVTTLVTVRSDSGLESAISLNVRPTVLPVPAFTAQPAISFSEGVATLSYALELGQRADMSRVLWYLCDDAQGTNPVMLAEGRTAPVMSLPLAPGYEGKTLMVTVEPKHIRSEYGQAVTVFSAPITSADLPAVFDSLTVDVHTFPVNTQTAVLPGLWSVDTYKPADANEGADFFGGWKDTEVAPDSLWQYGTGVKNGMKDYTGLYFTNRGARLRYTPAQGTYGDMELVAKVAPGKTGAQGFGSKNQYMEFLVKYDTANHVGYGLRIFRTTSNSCGFVLVAHKADGSAELLTEVADSGAFLTECTIRVWNKGGVLNAHVESTGTDATVDLTAPIAETPFGGACIQHTGTGGDNSVYIGSLQLNWN